MDVNNAGIEVFLHLEKCFAIAVCERKHTCRTQNKNIESIYNLHENSSTQLYFFFLNQNCLP